MTTDSSVLVPREGASLADLLEYVRDNGYQGLSDAQIDQVVEYRAETKATQTALVEMARQLISQGEQLQADARAAAERAQASFERACQTVPAFKEVSA